MLCIELLRIKGHAYDVLFLCTSASPGAILAEGGTGSFDAFSTGSFPKGDVHPLALQLGHPPSRRRWHPAHDAPGFILARLADVVLALPLLRHPVERRH